MSLIALPGENADRQDFFTAIHYLMKRSPLARKMLTALGEHPQEITVLVKEKYEEQRCQGSRIVRPNFIHWWVYDWTEVKKDEFMNPAMALMHELGHAYQWYIRRGLFILIDTRFNHTAAVEEDNLKYCEKPIAKELGQPQREKYTDNLPMGDRESEFRGWGKGPERQIN